MKLAPLLLAVVSVVQWATPAMADDSAESRAARYYAEGLELPLLQLRTGAMLIDACAQRLRRACDEEQRKLAAQSKVLTLLDALTLFPQRPPADPAASITRAAELREKIGATGARLMQEAGDYDQHLFARYGAALLVCPDADEGDGMRRATLSGLMHTNYGRFRALRPDLLATAIEATYREEELLAQRLRESPGHCVAVRRLGEYLMQLMHYKLQPWSAPQPEPRRNEFRFGATPAPQADASSTGPRERELAQAVAGNFISVVATELQLLVFPESAARIKEIAAENGFPSE